MRGKILKHNFLLYFKFCSKFLTRSAVLGDMRQMNKGGFGVFFYQRSIIQHAWGFGLQILSGTVQVWLWLLCAQTWAWFQGWWMGKRGGKGWFYSFQLWGSRLHVLRSALSGAACSCCCFCSSLELLISLCLRKGVQSHLAPLSSHWNTAWVCSWISFFHWILQLLGNVSVSSGINQW